LFVSLSQVLRVDFALEQRAIRLTGVEVIGTSTGASCPRRTRASSRRSPIRRSPRLPTLNRNFTDFLNLVPQISTKGPGNSGGGQNNRFNAIQIDGSWPTTCSASARRSSPAVRRRQTGVTGAIKEYQVLLSPYDVRQGSFTGFLERRYEERIKRLPRLRHLRNPQ
jgi:hypothetical protein